MLVPVTHLQLRAACAVRVVVLLQGLCPPALQEANDSSSFQYLLDNLVWWLVIGDTFATL